MKHAQLCGMIVEGKEDISIVVAVLHAAVYLTFSATPISFIKLTIVACTQVHSSNKPRLWNMNKDVIIACALCGKRAVLCQCVLRQSRNYEHHTRLDHDGQVIASCFGGLWPLLKSYYVQHSNFVHWLPVCSLLRWHCVYFCCMLFCCMLSMGTSLLEWCNRSSLLHLTPRNMQCCCVYLLFLLVQPNPPPPWVSNH